MLDLRKIHEISEIIIPNKKHPEYQHIFDTFYRLVCDFYISRKISASSEKESEQNKSLEWMKNSYLICVNKVSQSIVKIIKNLIEENKKITENDTKKSSEERKKIISEWNRVSGEINIYDEYIANYNKDSRTISYYTILSYLYKIDSTIEKSSIRKNINKQELNTIIGFTSKMVSKSDEMIYKNYKLKHNDTEIPKYFKPTLKNRQIVTSICKIMKGTLSAENLDQFNTHINKILYFIKKLPIQLESPPSISSFNLFYSDVKEIEKNIEKIINLIDGVMNEDEKHKDIPNHKYNLDGKINNIIEKTRKIISKIEKNGENIIGLDEFMIANIIKLKNKIYEESTKTEVIDAKTENKNDLDNKKHKNHKIILRGHSILNRQKNPEKPDMKSTNNTEKDSYVEILKAANIKINEFISESNIVPIYYRVTNAVEDIRKYNPQTTSIKIS